MNDELLRFVRAALARQVPKGAIRLKLLEARWPEDEVDAALDAFADVDFPIPIPRPKAYLSARDAFIYLALFTTLYISAISLGSLLYQLINRAYPDPAMMGMAVGAAPAARWSTSSLLIAFPVFLVLSRLTYRAVRQNPEKRTSKVRKWLTYLTLFVAAGVVLGDLVTLVFNLLGGEFTARFLLKVLTVGGIAGSVFGFYLWDLRQDEVDPERQVDRHTGVRIFSGVVTATVAATLIGGLILAGSPGEARAQRLDKLRRMDLQIISKAIDVYWSQRQALPEDLEQLGRERGVRLRSTDDPASREPYEYRITGETSYELCATFDREFERPESRRPGEVVVAEEPFWTHRAGRVCFSVGVVEVSRTVVESMPLPSEPDKPATAPSPPK